MGEIDGVEGGSDGVVEAETAAIEHDLVDVLYYTLEAICAEGR